VTIAGHTVTVTQSAAATAPCAYTVTPTTQNMPYGGGNATIDVANTQGTGCTWNATTNSSFLTIIEGANGSGSGKVTARASLNTGPQRTGTVTVAGQTVSVIQATQSCPVSLSPGSSSVPAGGGVVRVSVSTSGAACDWVAVSNSSFLTVDPGQRGANGTGFTLIAVAANAGLARTGTVTIANQTFTVSQAAGP
jgi:hypothetical protein